MGGNGETDVSDGSGSIELHDVSGLPAGADLSHEQTLALYKDMLVIRCMEEYLGRAYDEAKIRGFCHLVVGQEGLYAVLKSIFAQDCLVTSYRCHAAAYAAGVGLREIICENLGTADGCSKGRGGSMHIYGKKFFGGHGIVGAQVPLGAGLAFALKYEAAYRTNAEKVLDKDEFLSAAAAGVCFCIFGDGASNQGQVYETYNMARVYNLPVVFIVENNQYGMYTPLEEVTVDDCFFKRGYGIPGIRLRDTRISDLKRVLEFAREYSRAKGPIIVQVDTFRKCGHSTIDKSRFYIEKDVAEKNERLDCLLNLENDMKAWLGGDELDKIREEAREIIQKCVESIDSENTLGKDDLLGDLLYR